MADPATLPNLTDAELQALDQAVKSGQLMQMGGTVPSTSQALSSIAPMGAPDLQRPTSAQSRAAGKAEYQRGLPTITAEPFTPEYYQQEREKSDYAKLHPWGSDISAHPGFGGKLAHFGAELGNIAGNIVAPGEMALIPGTQLHNQVERTGQLRGFGQAVENEQSEAQTGLVNAQTEKLQHPEQTIHGTFSDEEGKVWEIMSNGQIVPTQLTAPDKNLNQTTDQELAAAVSDAQKRGVDPNADAKVQQILKVRAGEKPPVAGTGEEQAYSQWLKDNPTQKDSAANRLAFHNKWSPPTQIPLITAAGIPAGTFNPRAGTFNQTAPGGTIAAGAAAQNRQSEEFNKEYVNPGEATERSYQLFQDAYNAVKRGDTKTGAEDMLMLSQHLGTTFGQVKGSRMNKDLIQEHKNAIGIEDKIERFGNMLASGQQLSPDQRDEFRTLITDFRNLTWQMATKEGVRRGQKIDFVPSDVQIKLKAPDGSVKPVGGDRVQFYLDKGAKLAD